MKSGKDVLNQSEVVPAQGSGLHPQNMARSPEYPLVTESFDRIIAVSAKEGAFRKFFVRAFRFSISKVSGHMT